MNAELKQKVCLITGASRTLGADIARCMARHGAHVAVNYQESQQAALDLCEELKTPGSKAVPLQADVSKPEDVEQLVEQTIAQLGPIDVLVNTVGPYGDTPFLELPIADFDRIISGNISSTFLVSQTVGRHMKARGRGHIINIAATDIFYRSHSVYGLAKTGVVFLTEAMALELAPEVRINAIAPDLIADNENMEDGFVQKSLRSTPTAKLVTRAEIAAMACLLCTPAFDNVTGHTIVMDGGRSIHRIPFG